MPLQIVRNHPADRKIDAVVTAAESKGSGFFWGFRAGSTSVCDARDERYRYEIRTVCPAWKGGRHREEALLRRCYAQSLRLAAQKNCESVVIALLGENDPAFPKALLRNIATNAIREFLAEHEMQIYLWVRARDSLRMPGPLLQDVHQFIRRNYIDLDDTATTIVMPPHPMQRPAEKHLEEEECSARREKKDFTPPPRMSAQAGISFSRTGKSPAASAPAPRATEPARAATGSLPDFSDLKDLIMQTDAGFSETLLKLIDKTGKKDSDIYSRANITRQHFSKIRNNPDYKPTKSTAIAFAIALELDMAQTKDLIGRAGYALTESSKFDVIIMYFIQKRHYNIFDINEVLFEFDQRLLGA